MLTDTPPATAPVHPAATGLAGELDAVAAYLERHGDLPTTAVTVRRIAGQVAALEEARAPAPADAGGEVGRAVRELSRFASCLPGCAALVDPEEHGCTCGYASAWNAVFSRPALTPSAGEVGREVWAAILRVRQAERQVGRWVALKNHEEKCSAMTERGLALDALWDALAARARETEHWKAEVAAAVRAMAEARRARMDAESARDVEAAVRLSLVSDVAQAIGLAGGDLEEALNHPAENLLPAVAELRAGCEWLGRVANALRDLLEGLDWWDVDRVDREFPADQISVAQEVLAALATVRQRRRVRHG